MKEQLYTIPVNDAFQTDCECPLCSMAHSLEEEAIQYVMGSSYMEDSIRMETDRLGFCEKHMKRLYQHQNRLGLALILQSHMAHVIKEIQKQPLSAQKKVKAGLFQKKNEDTSPSYIDQLHLNCFICDKINKTFHRYLVTIFQLYKTDPNFRTLFLNSKGFCLSHYQLLFHNAPTYLKAKDCEAFLAHLNELFLPNLIRVKEDLDWFVDKFDYRYADEPWKNSEDALPRTLLKLNSILEEIQ